jgi:hypothetical protein
MALEYKPKGKRDIDRPKTRYRDQQRLQDLVFTGQDPGVVYLFAFMIMLMAYILNQMDPRHTVLSFDVESVDPWDFFPLPQFIIYF